MSIGSKKTVMLQFCSCLKKGIDAEIEKIENSEISSMTKSLEASRVLRDAYNELKSFSSSYTWKKRLK